MQTATEATTDYSKQRVVNIGIIGFGYRLEGIYKLVKYIAPKVVLYAVSDPDERRTKLA